MNYFSMYWEYLKFKRSSKWNKKQIEAFQDKQLIALVKHAAEHVPYYKELFQKIGFDVNTFRGRVDMHKIPLLDKDTVRNHYKDLIADNASDYGLHEETTSGSTGTPLKLLLDDATDINQLSSILRCYSWAKYSLFKKSFGLQSYLKYNYRVEDGIQHNWMMNVYRFDSNNLNKEEAIKLAIQLNEIQPKFYFGYPLPLTMLGKYATEAGITMYSPESIVVYGESLSETRRNLLESYYHTQIYDLYSMHERAAMIGTCSSGERHLMEDFAYNEIVDEDGNLITNGVGELVGTNLFNKSMPLIRYKTRDLVEIMDEDTLCSCGCSFRHVKRIIGRQNDFIKTPDGRVLGNVMEHSIDKSVGVIMSQCVQDAIDHIYINLITDESFDPKYKDAILVALRKRIGNQIKVDFKIVSELEQTKGGKTPFILSKLGNNYI